MRRSDVLCQNRESRRAIHVRCRVLFLVGEFHTGGLERQLYYLLQAMHSQGYRPSVAVWNYNARDYYVPKIEALGIPLYSLDETTSRAAKLNALRKLVRRLQPELIHSYSFYTNFAAYLATLGTAVIPIGSIRSDFTLDRRACGPILGRLSSRWPCHQISNSLSGVTNARALRSFFAPVKLSIVRNAIDFERFHSFPMPQNLPVRILGIGYLLPVKRWERLLKAVERLKRTGLDCLVKIAGEGPLRNDLERQVAQLGISDRVVLAGHVDDVSELIAEAAFVVHTADSEGCPNAIMEALACGRPVVATDVGDVPHMIKDGITGYLVSRQDENSLVDRMVKLIKDPSLCARLGKAGHEYAEQNFGLKRLVEETLTVYRTAGWEDD